MNNHQEGDRGASIIPSARGSIHKYRDNTMVRYGLNDSTRKNNRVNSLCNNAQGLDEVDNIVSKMQKINPLQGKKKNRLRTNSYSQVDESNDDYSSNKLSKSLPSTLSPRLYSSDDSLPDLNYSAASIIDSRLEESLNGRGSDKSNQSFDTPRRFDRELSVTATPKTPRRQESNKSYFILTAVSLVILLIAWIFYEPSMISVHVDIINRYKSTQTENYDVKLFENNMDNLREKYNIDGDLILKLKTGISTIFSKSDTASFMFVYNSETDNFNSLQFDKFINEVAYTSARYLRNDIYAIQHTVILSSNLDMQEHSELINRYKDDVDKSGVLLVKEVDSVPSKLAMAFHYYCDEYNPLIKRSAIFFTLNLANCSNTSARRSTHEFIEKCLAGKWKTISPENIRPLLTRVVDSIIDVTSVF